MFVNQLQSGKQRNILNIDNESNDSGNNSMNTNGSGKQIKIFVWSKGYVILKSQK